MKAEKQEYTVTTVTLSLNEKEAKWLKATMQNPLSEPETPAEGEIRLQLWMALDQVGIK